MGYTVGDDETFMGVTFPTDPGIALQGTTLPAKYREYLLHFCNIIVALDPDAGKKNLDMVKELRPYTNSVYPFRLTDDLKYRNESDIKKLYRMTDQWN